MIQFDPENAADPFPCFVATTTAAIIAATAAAGGAIASGAMQSHAVGEAAKTQADAAKTQADADIKAAEIQAQSARDALAYSRSQSQSALDQYNAQQVRLQPYRNLGNFAMGRPNEDAPRAMRLPALPASDGASPVQSQAVPPTRPQAPTRLSALGSQGVMVQAPTGETRRLAPPDAQRAVQLGGRVIGCLWRQAGSTRMDLSPIPRKEWALVRRAPQRPKARHFPRP